MTFDPAIIEPIKMVLFDVDGVLTDGRIVIDDNGMESKFFDVRDGTGIKWLVRANYKVAFLTGRSSRVVEHRARELGVDKIYQGLKVKIEAYEELLAEFGLSDREAAYIGDDLIDLPILRRVGLAMAPADARPEVKSAVHYVCRHPSGRGAAREISELIIRNQGRWEEITAVYF
ncbi:MAG: HAD-IIIA family hydrolase [Candidatus Adiutricales bacterium]